MREMEQRFVNEIAAAIARAAAEDTLVQAWREMAQAAGFRVGLPLASQQELCLEEFQKLSWTANSLLRTVACGQLSVSQ